MPNDDQAQVDSTDTTPVADPLDSANNPHGTSGLAEYEAELQSIMNAEPEEVQGEEPAAEDPVEVEADEEVVEEEESLPEEEEEEAPEPKAKDRFRFKDPTDQAVAAIAKAKGISLLDAAKIFEGQNPTERQVSEVQDTTPKETVDSVEDQIKALRAKRSEAQKGLEFEVVPEIEAELDALIDKRQELKLKEAQDRVNAESQQISQFEADYAKSERLTVAYYPDTTKADSPLVKKMEEIDARMKRLNDPIYYSPDKPFQLAKIAARELGIPMADPKSPVQKKAAARPVQPAGGNARTTAPVPAVRQEKAIDGIGSMEAYERFVGAVA